MNFSLKPGTVREGRGLTSSLLSTATKVLSKIPIGAVVNTVIDALPVELHLPGYQYCGPGTKVKERLARGDTGINKLDKACKEHDIAYYKYSDTSNRTLADKALADKAWERVKAPDASLGERAAALAVTGAMRAKTVVGAGRRRRHKKSVGSGRRKVKSSKKNQRGGRIKKRKQGRKKSPPLHQLYGAW